MKNKDVFSLSAMMQRMTRRTGAGLDSSSGSVNNSDLIDQALYQKWVTAKDGLNAVPKLNGHSLSMGKRRTIAVVTPFFIHASQFKRLLGVMSVVSNSNYNVRLFTVETISQRNRILERVLRRGQIDGLLIFLIHPTETDVHDIQRENLPTVLVETHHPEFHSLVLDDITAAQTAVHYLLNLGHRKIAYVGEDLDDRFDLLGSRHSYQGYCQALETAGLPLDRTYHCQAWPRREQVQQLVLDLLNLAEPPTAIFTSSDELGFYVLEAARGQDLSVPGDLSVISFNDTELAQFAQLTTVRRHLFQAGAEGTKLLLEAIDQPDRPPTQVQLATELVIRQTTAAPGN